VTARARAFAFETQLSRFTQQQLVGIHGQAMISRSTVNLVCPHMGGVTMSFTGNCGKDTSGTSRAAESVVTNHGLHVRINQ